MAFSDHFLNNYLPKITDSVSKNCADGILKSYIQGLWMFDLPEECNKPSGKPSCKRFESSIKYRNKHKAFQYVYLEG